MKMKCIALMLALAAVPAVMAEEEKCPTDEIKESSHPLIEIITIPFKAIVAITYGPRCLLSNIPKNE